MMHLCGASLSPYFERANLVARFKGAGRDIIQLGGMPFEMKSEEHLAAVPTGKIPFLMRENGPVLIESQVIAEYLDAVLPGPALMPADADGRAGVQLLCRIIDLYLAPNVERFWNARGYDDSARQEALDVGFPKAWDALEFYLSDTGYAYGDDFTIADLALIPWIFHMESFVKPVGDYGVAERPKLINWFAHAGASDMAKTSFERSEKSRAEIQARMRAARAAKG